MPQRSIASNAADHTMRASITEAPQPDEDDGPCDRTRTSGGGRRRRTVGRVEGWRAARQFQQIASPIGFSLKQFGQGTRYHDWTSSTLHPSQAYTSSVYPVRHFGHHRL